VSTTVETASAAARTAPAAVIVAIDGPSGTGKSSTSKAVAAQLGLSYLDTGAQYRAITWWMLNNGIDVQNAAEVATAADKPVIVSGTDPLGPSITLDGDDVSEEIRSDVVNAHVSPVATVPAVRARLIALQREVIEDALDGAGIVVEGRDIGTAVWPDADLKLYVTADPAARAARRALEEGGHDAHAVRASLETRDHIDSTRGGLAVPEGAVHVDTTPYTLDEVIGQIVALAERVSERARA